jgi:hypothetical protein
LYITSCESKGSKRGVTKNRKGIKMPRVKN